MMVQVIRVKSRNPGLLGFSQEFRFQVYPETIDVFITYFNADGVEYEIQRTNIPIEAAGPIAKILDDADDQFGPKT